MPEGKTKLTIHTSIVPEDIAPVGAKRKKTIWEALPRPRLPRRTRVRAKTRRKTTNGERLLRNAAIACSLLLLSLALKNVDTPLTNRVVGGIREAVTMRVDLDEALGRLQFVRDIMPEDALVFWNMGEEAEWIQPVAGTLTHDYTAAQPWQEYACQEGDGVRAAADGVVAAVGQGAGGDWTILIDHGDGRQTVYAFLKQALVETGQSVTAGQRLGAAGAALYYELREDGVARSPEA